MGTQRPIGWWPLPGEWALRGPSRRVAQTRVQYWALYWTTDSHSSAHRAGQGIGTRRAIGSEDSREPSNDPSSPRLCRTWRLPKEPRTVEKQAERKISLQGGSGESITGPALIHWPVRPGRFDAGRSRDSCRAGVSPTSTVLPVRPSPWVIAKCTRATERRTPANASHFLVPRHSSCLRIHLLRSPI